MAKANCTQATEPTVLPACSVRLQCSDKRFREIAREKIESTYSECGHCFPDGVVDVDRVVVGRSGAARSMHLKHTDDGT